MESQRPSRISAVEPYCQDSKRDDKEECDCRNYSMGSNKIVVLGLLGETVSHACQMSDSIHVGVECACGLPLYRIVAKFKPTRLGSRKVFSVASHVPSPTTIVFEV